MLKNNLENNNTQQPDKISLESLKKQELLEIIWNALNKSSKAGVFNIDES